MKLKNRLYLFSSFIIIVTTFSVLFAGMAIIDQIIYTLNRRILTLEVDNAVKQIDDAYDILKNSGVENIDLYQKSVKKEIINKFKRRKLWDAEKFYLIDPQGDNDPNQDYRIFTPAAFQKIIYNQKGFLEFSSHTDDEKMFCEFATSRQGLKVMLIVPQSVIFNKRNLYFASVAFIGIIVLIITLTISYLFSASFTDNIFGILDIIRKVAKGDLTVKIEQEPFSIEHKELQDGINAMIEGLRAREMERERAEEESRKHQKLESVGILAGGIAHDFNNLLTAIRGNLQLAQLHPLDKELEACLKDSETATVRAMNLTQQLLTFAKGGVPVKETALIVELLENTANFVLRGTKTKCEFYFSDDLAPVEIDSGQMNQVIHNIVLNASQAMPDGGVISIRAENVDISSRSPLPLPMGKYVKISIADQGNGIKPEDIDKIFDPFFTTKNDGSGLGLSTSYNIVKKHGGLITVDSHIGIGSLFFIYLPASLKEIKKETEEVSQDYSGGGRILIMDDQDSIRELLTRMLTTMGCECKAVEDGESAIDEYQQAFMAGAPYDIVFMDLTIPGGMGGKDAIQEILKIDPEVVAVVASGYSNDPIMADFARYGFKGRLEKPFKISDLQKLLASLMTRKKPQ
jgi:signal transduction histidine kinase/CheY-like chemotaxis protein